MIGNLPTVEDKFVTLRIPACLKVTISIEVEILEYGVEQGFTN